VQKFGRAVEMAYLQEDRIFAPHGQCAHAIVCTMTTIPASGPPLTSAS